MAKTLLKVDVSYSQLAIFWTSHQIPFNDWTQQHVDQGFAWRPGSVSFRTLVESGLHSVEIEVVDHLATTDTKALRIFEVPFDVPSNGEVELASISDSVPISLPAGKYLLRCEFVGGNESGMQLVRLLFAKADDQHFAVVRADDALHVPQVLLTTAEPASM